MTATSLTPERRTPKGTAAGVLDTIADAVTFVIQRPWLMVVPILVDLVMWLVVRVSMLPIVERMTSIIETSGVDGYQDVVAGLRENGDQVMVTDYLGAFVPSLFAGMSLDTLLSALMMFISPEGFGIPRNAMYEPWSSGLVDTFVPDSAGNALLALGASMFASTIALILFRVPMARAIRGTRSEPLLKEMARGWFRLLLYFVMMVAIAAASIVPLALLSMLVLMLGSALSFLVALAFVFIGGMLGIYTLFVVDAMLIHRTDPRTAFRLSYAVGKQYFSQVSRFAITSIFLMLATMRIWTEMASSGPGFIVAMVGSAFIGTVLAAASMFFYTDRYRLIRAAEAGTRNTPPAAPLSR